MKKIKINKKNVKSLEEIYVHDSYLKEFNYNYEMNTLDIILINNYTFFNPIKETTKEVLLKITFSNLLGFEANLCKFFLSGGNILCCSILNNNELIINKKMLKIQNENNYSPVSELGSDREYIELNITLNSGENFVIASETITIEELDS